MQRLESIDQAAWKGAYLAIGSFDGVHRGHRHLLTQMMHSAREDHAPSVALTFFPHPRIILQQNPASVPFRYLSTLEERIAQLENIGLDAVIPQPFDLEFSRIPAADFLTILKNRLGLRALWCGPEFALGYRREGDVVYLTEHGLSSGFLVFVIPPLLDKGGPISSSRIRSALAQGGMAEAADLLGRPFMLSGKVVHGAGRGRGIGIPTANLAVWAEIMIPMRGVYVSRVEHRGRWYRGVTSIGVRPTFENGTSPMETVETHLLDFDGDLYGADLRLEFGARLREERRFPSVAALVNQMHRDIEQTRILPPEAL